MQQLTQQLKDGKMEILEVPCPAMGKGQVLVRNHYSLISSGTEGKTVSDARKGYIAKARARQKEVNAVIELVKKQGIKAAYGIVMNKLEAPSPLGYSCAGEIIAVAEDITDLKPGDLVACGGQGAYHADIVSVYRNLCVKIPRGTNLKHASFTTVASVALQGIRQADIQAGGNCVVIGLGLLGQLTCQLLNASGIKSIGVDISDRQVNAAIKAGARVAFNRSEEGLELKILDETGGYGADAVIITAATTSTDPVELAGILCRQKGKVIIVGAVPTGFSRTSYYRKELDLRMSSSYGPGRYDPVYEEKGLDYPVGYVRWTENRNMQAFIELLSAGKLDVDSLISHEFDISGAYEAYDLILSGSKTSAGIILSYDTEKAVLNDTIVIGSSRPVTGIPVAGFIGAGNFARNFLLPNLRGHLNFRGIATAHGTSSLFTGRKYGFEYCTSLQDKIFSDDKIDTVFIATRHNSHADSVIRALKAGKNVFVEKPLAITLSELEQIRQVYIQMEQKPLVMVGYNRRFAPFTKYIMRTLMPGRPKGISILVNAGALPSVHWVNDPETGGGRITGEGCHFIDLAIFLAGSPVISVSAGEIGHGKKLPDSFVATLTFANGSAASVSYLSNGSKDAPKEAVHVFCDGTVSSIDDFRTLKFFGKKIHTIKSKQDKGHKAELLEFVSSVKNCQESPIPFEQLYHTSLVTFKIQESMRTGNTIYIDHKF